MPIMVLVSLFGRLVSCLYFFFGTITQTFQVATLLPVACSKLGLNIFPLELESGSPAPSNAKGTIYQKAEKVFILVVVVFSI